MRVYIQKNEKHVDCKFDEIGTIIDEVLAYKKKEDIKILLNIDAGRGLGDAFGTLNMLLFIAVVQKQLAPNQLYFYKNGYVDLYKFVNFKEIHLVKSNTTNTDLKIHINSRQYDIIISGGKFSGLYITHSAHFRNYVSYTDDLKKEAEKHAKPYGVHFRFKRQERQEQKKKHNNITPEAEFSKYMTSFLKEYKSDRKYFLCSDCTVVNSNINEFSNIHTIPKTINQWKSRKTRGRVSASAAMTDLAILSQCKSIYTHDNSGFVVLAILFSDKDIPFEKTTPTNGWPNQNIKEVLYKLGYLIKI